MDTTKKVCLFALGAAFGAFTLKLLRVKEEYAKRAIQQKQAQEQQQLNKEQLKKIRDLQQLLIHKKKYFQIEYEAECPQFLTQECLINFIKNSGQLISGQEFAAMYDENRRARRSVFGEIQQKYEVYFRFVCTLDENIKYLIQKSEKDFAAFLDIDFNRIVESIEYQLEIDEFTKTSAFRENLLEITTQMREQLSLGLPLYNQPVDKQLLMEILNYQIELFETKSDFILDLVDKIGLENKDEEEAMPLFFNFFIADAIYDKFKVQIEQMTLQQLSPQFQQKYNRINYLKDSLIQKIHQLIEQNLIMYENNENSQGEGMDNDSNF